MISAGIDSLGSGAYLGVSILVLTRYLDIPPVRAGFLLTIGAVAAFLLVVPVGALGDRIGTRRVLLGLHMVRCVAYLALLLRPPEILVAVVLMVTVTGERAATPMLQALVGDVDDADRVGTMARVRMLQNVGFSLGALAASAGLLVESNAGLGWVIVLNAVTFAVAGAVVTRAPTGYREPRSSRTKRTYFLRDGRFATATVVSAVLGMHAQLLTIVFPLWIVTHTSVPSWCVPLVLTVNASLVVLLQVRMSRNTDSVSGAGRALAQAGLMLAAALALIPLSSSPSLWGSLPILLVALVAQTGAEVRHQAGAWGISYALAPADRRGVYLSFFSTGNIVRHAVAPVLFTALVADGSTWGWWVTAAVVAVLGIATYRLTLRWSQAERQPVVEPI